MLELHLDSARAKNTVPYSVVRSVCGFQDDRFAAVRGQRHESAGNVTPIHDSRSIERIRDGGAEPTVVRLLVDLKRHRRAGVYLCENLRINPSLS